MAEAQARVSRHETRRSGRRVGRKGVREKRRDLEGQVEDG
jgi:hypothetical protein